MYVINSSKKCIESFPIFPRKLPKVIAIPWLKREPKATPKRIVVVRNLDEKDKTRIWVLSPSSEINTSVNAIINGYM